MGPMTLAALAPRVSRNGRAAGAHSDSMKGATRIRSMSKIVDLVSGDDAVAVVDPIRCGNADHLADLSANFRRSQRHGNFFGASGRSLDRMEISR